MKCDIKWEAGDNEMVRRKTLFVVGAGAGFEIDMPLGDRLSRTIGVQLV
jgi:hypothetical protein